MAKRGSIVDDMRAADPADRADKHKLLPHSHLNIGRDFCLHSGLLEYSAQPLGLFVWPVIQLAEGDVGFGADVNDVAGCGKAADDAARPAQRWALSQDLRQACRSLNAVLQRHHDRLWADHRADGPGRLGHLPGFHPDHNSVYRAHLRGILGRLDGVHHEVALRTVYAQTLLPKGCQVRPARDKEDLFARPCQATSEIASYGSNPNDRDAHDFLSTVKEKVMDGNS